MPPPTRREWGRHALLFAATALTATLAGIFLAAPPELVPALAEPARWFDYFTYVPLYYVAQVWLVLREAFYDPPLFTEGVKFAASLLAILAAHEAGHYVACRRHRVPATLPFFLPAPPLFLAGTFGAFIKIKAPITSRRALIDIGLAGPLAGFVVAVPVAVIGIVTARPPVSTGEIIFNDPLLFRLVAWSCGVQLSDVAGNSFYFAAWIGLLVTSLNLLPVGQLDGGHAVLAVFGRRAHYWSGRVALAAMCALTFLGWQVYGLPTGLLYTLLLFFVLRAVHPPLIEAEPLGRARQAVFWLTALIFALCFTPFPITIR